MYDLNARVRHVRVTPHPIIYPWYDNAFMAGHENYGVFKVALRKNRGKSR
jgi:hypothetical protein